MAHTNGRIGFIHMLSTGSSRAIRIDLYIFRSDNNIDRILNVGDHLDFGKGCMATMSRIKRRETNQAMSACL